MDEELLQEVKARQEELKLLHGDSVVDELKINEILRDEFSNEEYEEILIDLGINEELDLEEEDPYEKEDNINNDDEKDYNTLIKTLLVTKEGNFQTEMKLRGFDKENNKWVKKRNELLPSNDITFIMEFLTDNLSPQAFMSKLKSKTKEYDDSMNGFITKFNEKYENYPDNIINVEELTDVIQMILSKIMSVRRVIQDGDLGKALKEMIVGSYKETQEPEIKKRDLLKEALQ